MPIVVDPGFAWPPEVDPVVSPDGKLTAIVDPAHAGVLLRADFDDSVPDTPAMPEKVLRRNLATNPSVEIDTTYWAASSGGAGGSGQRVAGGRTGGYCYKALYPSGVSGIAGIYYREWSVAGEQGDVVSAGMWVKSPVGTTVQLSLSAQLGDVRAGGVVSDVFNATGDWQFLSVKNMVLNGPYEYVNVYVRTSNIEAGAEQFADDVIIIRGRDSSTTYFDGDTPATPDGRHYRWLEDGTSEEYIPATPFIPGKPGTVAKVRFERQDGSAVRSGDPAWAPGGYAHAYDHEATLGGGTLWRAVPIRFDGTEGTPSQYVGAVIPGLSDGWGWFKPVTDPDKALLLRVEPPDIDYDGRLDTTSIAASRRPAATWDLLEGFTTQLRSLVKERDVEDKLMDLLDQGPVLAQFPACAGIPDFFFIREKVTAEHVHWDGYPWRRYTIPVVAVDRPTTVDTPLRIPSLSYDTVERDWVSYNQLEATVESYNDLLTEGDEGDAIIWDGGYPDKDEITIIDGGQP